MHFQAVASAFLIIFLCQHDALVSAQLVGPTDAVSSQASVNPGPGVSSQASVNPGPGLVAQVADNVVKPLLGNGVSSQASVKPGLLPNLLPNLLGNGVSSQASVNPGVVAQVANNVVKPVVDEVGNVVDKLGNALGNVVKPGSGVSSQASVNPGPGVSSQVSVNPGLGVVDDVANLVEKLKNLLGKEDFTGLTLDELLKLTRCLQSIGISSTNVETAKMLQVASVFLKQNPEIDASTGSISDLLAKILENPVYAGLQPEVIEKLIRCLLSIGISSSNVEKANKLLSQNQGILDKLLSTNLQILIGQ